MKDELNEAAKTNADELWRLCNWQPTWDDLYESFIAGAKWHKEQMLKDAMEADVNVYRDLAEGESWAEFVARMPTQNLGDKVHMVIIKEGEK